jgi:hypothetical protein
MEWHPHALTYPLLEGEEYEAFKKDIRENGQREAVKYRMYRGQKQGLDGRNRECACKELGIDCRYEKVFVDDADVEAYIDSRNLHRRHLTAEQRRNRVLALRAGGQSTREIAASLGVSQTTVVNDLKGDEAAPGEQNCSPEARNGAKSTIPASPQPPRVTGKDGKSYPANKQPDANSEPEIPARLREAFNCVPSLKKAVRRANQAANAFEEAEKTCVYLDAVKGKAHEQHSTTFRTAASRLKSMTPVRPCPDCGGAYEPSLENDSCGTCLDKGYLTSDEADQ